VIVNVIVATPLDMMSFASNKVGVITSTGIGTKKNGRKRRYMRNKSKGFSVELIP
jgi:hypothetical protein